jgi:hypothetical protein
VNARQTSTKQENIATRGMKEKSREIVVKREAAEDGSMAEA